MLPVQDILEEESDKSVMADSIQISTLNGMTKTTPPGKTTSMGIHHTMMTTNSSQRGKTT